MLSLSVLFQFKLLISIVTDEQIDSHDGNSQGCQIHQQSIHDRWPLTSFPHLSCCLISGDTNNRQHCQSKGWIKGVAKAKPANLY